MEEKKTRAPRTPSDYAIAKEYFQRVARAEKELSRLSARIQHYEELGLVRVKPLDAPGGSGSPSRSMVEIAAVGLADATNDMLSEIRQYEALIRGCEALIAQIPVSRYRDILDYHYLSGMPLHEICAKMKYTDRNSIYRAHGYALSAAGKLMRQLNLYTPPDPPSPPAVA